MHITQEEICKLQDCANELRINENYLISLAIAGKIAIYIHIAGWKALKGELKETGTYPDKMISDSLNYHELFGLYKLRAQDLTTIACTNKARIDCVIDNQTGSAYYLIIPCGADVNKNQSYSIYVTRKELLVLKSDLEIIKTEINLDC